MENKILVSGKFVEVMRGPTLDDFDRAVEVREPIPFELKENPHKILVFVEDADIIPVKPNADLTRDRPEGRKILKGFIVVNGGRGDFRQPVVFDYYPEGNVSIWKEPRRQEPTLPLV